MARRANKPVWLLVAEMEPERLVELSDFKHIADFVSKDEALALLHQNAIDQLPVVDDDGCLLGLLDVQDLLNLKVG
mgnify:CR=1 FL=1